MEFLKEAIHGLFEGSLVMGDVCIDVQFVQRGPELLTEAPEAGEADGGGVEVILSV